jgi:hypothetical protein
VKRSWRAWLLLLLIWAPAAAGDSVFARIEETFAELSRITGLPVKRPVKRQVIPREELKRFLERRIREEIKPEEIRIEELLLKKFGFAPPEFDLKKSVVDLYAEQAAAFYDFHKKRLFVLENDDAAAQESALIHELAHALADQHFRLARFLDDAGTNDDGALARMAVMEGQATWLMSEVQARRMGRSLRDSPGTAALMSRMMAASPGQFPVFDSAPRYLRESLLFPYTSGMTFQQAVVDRLGDRAFAAVFQDPPASTREILHPETYFARDRLEAPRLPALRRPRDYRELAAGTLGEFDYAVLLVDFVNEESARRIAPRWRAGAYRLAERKRDRRTVLQHVSRWDSEEGARQFFEAYRTIARGKWKSFELSSEDAARIEGRGDDGFFVFRLDGRDVYCTEGLAEAGDAGTGALSGARLVMARISHSGEPPDALSPRNRNARPSTASVPAAMRSARAASGEVTAPAISTNSSALPSNAAPRMMHMRALFFMPLASIRSMGQSYIGGSPGGLVFQRR